MYMYDAQLMHTHTMCVYLICIDIYSKIPFPLIITNMCIQLSSVGLYCCSNVTHNYASIFKKKEYFVNNNNLTKL